MSVRFAAEEKNSDTCCQTRLENGQISWQPNQMKIYRISEQKIIKSK